jgi:hypothetical protein
VRIPRRPIHRARRAALVGAALIAALATGAIVLHAHGRDGRRARIDPVSVKAVRAKPRALVPRTLASRRAGRLYAPLQDAAAVPLDGSRAMLLGGLTAADRSTDAVDVISHNGDRASGHLPSAVHDAAAARLGGSVYLFGGGDGTRQHDEIVRVGRGIVGRLPAPSSDQAAAAIGSTAYVVGGFTGTHWLDTIVAWSLGRGARIVARLPTPVRYAAVTSTGGKLIVAGGSLPDGEASSRVFEYTPSS